MKLMNKKINILMFAIILLVAISLRFYRISDLPPSLNWDEVSHGYNAYSILKSGTDEWGRLPIANFRAYGDYPTTLYMYLTIPWIALFDLNEFSVRLTSAFFGSLLIIVSFLLTKQIIKSNLISLFVAFLVAISPWTLLTSRQVLQATPAIFFLSLGVVSFLKGIEGKRILTLLGTIFLGLSSYGYHNTRILAPLILILLIFLFFKQLIKQRKYLILNFLIGLIFFLPLVYVILLGGGSARSVWVGILDQGAISEINLQRSQSNLPDPLPRLLHNKASYFLNKSVNNYIGYFSPQFLGISGGTHYQFSIPGFGVLFLIQLPLLYIGLIFLILRFKTIKKDKKFLLLWFLVTPIPAAVTRDPFQVVRALTMVPAIFIISGMGLQYVLNFLTKLNHKIIFPFIGILVFVLLVQFSVYIHNLFYIYPKNYSFAWQYGYKQAVNFLDKYGHQYGKIYITKKYGEPHEFVLFYTKYDPIKYRNDPSLVRYEKSNWFWIDSFDKYHFLNDWEVKQRAVCVLPEKCLLITSPGNYPPNSQILTTINFLDGQEAFEIVAVK